MPTITSLHQVKVSPELYATDVAHVKRETFGGNVTSSTQDHAFAEFRHRNLSPEEKRQLADWNFCFERSRSSIEHHLDKRVSHLFVQAVVCYQTEYRYREGRTLHQGFNASGLEDLKFQAAHHPTIPCLYAKAPGSDKEIVYLYRSGAYDEGNATFDLLKAVNDADRAIDEKYAESELRKKTITLLNTTAEGNLTPEGVLKQFIPTLIAEINKAITREKNAEVRDVLNLYLDHAELLWSSIDQPETIDRLLGLNMEDSMQQESLMIVDVLNQETAVEKEKLLELIKRFIENLPAVINHERHQKKNECYAPPHFYDIFHREVLRKLSKVDQKIVEEALNVKLTDLEKLYRGFKKKDKSEGLLQEHAEKIDRLIQSLLPLIGAAQGKTARIHDLSGISQERKVCLRPNVYKLRYRMILEDQKAQSAIKSKIEAILNEIRKGKRRTPYVETFFYAELLKSAKNEKQKEMLCKLVNISSSNIFQSIRELKVNQVAHSCLERHGSLIYNLKQLMHSKTLDLGQVNAVYKQLESDKNPANLKLLFYRRLFDFVESQDDQVFLENLLKKTLVQINQDILARSKKTEGEKLVEKNLTKVKEAFDVFEMETKKLQAETKRFHRELMIELRKSHAMKQEHFIKTYKADNPNYPMSTGTMSNLETGKKEITPMITEQVSKIFGVSKDLFNPSHFAA